MDVPNPHPMPVALPHAGSMCWVQQAMLEDSGNKAYALARISSANAFVRDGQFLPSALIEVMAQAAAAGSSLKAQRSGRRVKRGLLVAIPEFEVMERIAVNDSVELQATAVHEKTFGPLSQAVIEVHYEGRRIARARMTFHLEFE